MVILSRTYRTFHFTLSVQLRFVERPRNLNYALHKHTWILRIRSILLLVVNDDKGSLKACQ
jgi:hypothetical protein